jgi:hypothetical protein
MAADSTVSDLDERVNASKHVRRQFEGRWLVNMAYYLDHQWVRVDPSGRVFNVGLGEELPTLQENRIQPSVRADVAKMTKNSLEWVGVPKNRSDEEIQAARLRTDIFDDHWQRLQMRRKLRNAIVYQRNCSAAFFKTTWDNYSGAKTSAVFRKGEKRPIQGQQGVYTSLEDVPEELHEGLEERDVNFGEANIEVKSPFEVYPDALATQDGLISCEYIAEESVYSPHYLQTRFGKDFEGDTTATTGALEARFPGFAQVQPERGAAGRKGVRVREYWSLPGVDAPGGRHVVWVVSTQEILVEEDNPYPWLPYSMLGGIPSGRFWPEAPVTIGISLQTELNKTLSQVAANAERIGNPPLLVAAGSFNNEEGVPFTGKPGAVEVFEDLGTPGSVPQFMQTPEMPMYVQQRPDEIRNAMREVFGQMEVSQGTAPPGVTAASAINLLLEANDTMLGPDIAEMEDCITDMGRKLLWVCARYVTDERMLRISGENGAWDIRAWRGNQLRDAGADEVQAGSGIPQSKAAKQAAIQQFVNLFIQNGQALPPRVLKRVMKDMEVGGLEHFFSDVGKTEAQVEEEHRIMLEGEYTLPEPVPVMEEMGLDPMGRPLQQQATAGDGTPLFYLLPTNDFDEDELHLESHYEFFRSPRFLELGRQGPQGKMQQILMLGHAKLHEIKLQKAANNAAAAQMTMENAAPGQQPPLAPESLGGATNGVPSGPPLPPGG